MADLRKAHHSLPSKMLLKRRWLLSLLMILLLSEGCFQYAGYVSKFFRVIRYTNELVENPKPVVIHHNRQGRNEIVACVIETSLGDACDGLGFGALVLQAIDDITTCLARGFVPTVMWTDCNYCGPPGNGQNYWTWYFKALPDSNRSKGRIGGLPVCRLGNKVTEYYQPITAEIRALANHVISGYLQPAARIKTAVDTFYQSFMADSINIGVHVRLQSSHAEEMAFFDQTPPELHDFVQVVQRLINDITAKNKGREIRIYLASDLDEVIKEFKSKFGNNRVLHIDAFRGESLNDDRIREGSPNLLGDQVFTDILLMSKCDYFVHDESNVASVTYYYNPNLKSYYVSGDASDFRRLNAQPRFDSEELFRQAVVRETRNIILPDWKNGSLWVGLKVRVSLLWGLLFTDGEKYLHDLSCFSKNVKWS
ncbi:PREDICTED: uncharacterized protein LOC109477803 [Branchiostoma belcheri]|uniref:Uncharacterized protein LOC109477803 n=1 Tax=Branchiostoma belcheri TaxID=7741 RepID=A0A6P4ZDH6_BRABE|nr:PREDICTED: uncharacterized protein LOC109477803 [Branchiostoma belcheri]